MLKLKIEDRLSLSEIINEMLKMNEILKDLENNMMIISERKEILYNNDKIILTLPIIYPSEYYLESNKRKSINNIIIFK